MKRKILISGFEPFGGESINPSWEAVKLLPDGEESFDVEKILIPTVYSEAAEMLYKRAVEIGADMVISVGQAGGRAAITPEVLGINLREASIADNAGVVHSGEPIRDGAPSAYFSTVAVRDMVSALREQGIPAALSYSAGAFVCNDVLYTLLDRFDKSGVKIGFIHVPYIPEQTMDKENKPSMPLEKIADALRIAICAAVEKL
jgi:pyroglutamyl-peptidase